MRSIALHLIYMGTACHGWQVQKNAVIAAETLEHSLASVVGHPVKCTGAGRTDVGVYAETYIVNFHTSSCIPYDRIPLAANIRLPDDIAMIGATEVSGGFSTTGSCLKKEYTYRIYNSHIWNAFYVSRAWFYPKYLDETVMQRTVSHSVSTHDFAAVRSTGIETHTTVRTAHYLNTSRSGKLTECQAYADSSLYNIVRAMVGTCAYTADGKLSPDDVPATLEGRNRIAAGLTVPAGGLYTTRL